MPKPYFSYTYNPIIRLIKRNGLTNTTMYNALGMSQSKFEGLLKHPYNFKVKDLLIMSSLLRVDYLTLLEMLIVNNPVVEKVQVKTIDEAIKAAKRLQQNESI